MRQQLVKYNKIKHKHNRDFIQQFTFCVSVCHQVLDGVLRDVNTAIRTDSRVSSNLLVSLTNEDEVPRLSSLPRGSQLHCSAVWSCRERLSLLSLKHIVEHHEQKENLPLLQTFLQKVST